MDCFFQYRITVMFADFRAPNADQQSCRKSSLIDPALPRNQPCSVQHGKLDQVGSWASFNQSSSCLTSRIYAVCIYFLVWFSSNNPQTFTFRKKKWGNVNVISRIVKVSKFRQKWINKSAFFIPNKQSVFYKNISELIFFYSKKYFFDDLNVFSRLCEIKKPD